MSTNKIALNKLKEILRELNKVPGIVGSAIVKKDGEVILREMPEHITNEFMNILSVIEGFAEKTLYDTTDIAVRDIVIRGRNETFMVANIHNVFLILVLSSKANLNNISKIIDDYSDEITKYCSMLFESPVELPIKELFTRVKRKKFGRDVDVGLFRAFRYLNFRKYLNVDSDALMFYFGKELIKSLKINNFEEFSEFYEKYKLGELQMINEDPIVIRIYDCISCAGLPYVGKPLCHLEAGFLSGFVENAYGKKCRVIETHCYGLGHDFCQFEIKFLDKNSNKNKSDNK
ncbi:DUF2507 domain-containing protein [Methanocaldococcus fervens]|uniref:4-vinyl reductase 4VR n=1 Tax=Methanocaldococcus fervens (strain DSM 4213 / JCM 15782 / AG86) TaxID=573064 RepID=C7P805_METFA|nr:V4R domain-containing protein [Methanocaldococcus fervens]ACV24687.1 4-vinyl reductase 4VR [Methanocaldococcus fervens AG86]